MQKPHLLVVEDDTHFGLELRRYFRTFFTIVQSPTVAAAIAQLNQRDFEIILLDRVLPDGDGLDLLKMLPQISPNTKVCIMSQRDELAERIAGLHQGADLYLPKPVELAELRAYLHTLLRRGKLYSQQVLQRQDLTLDLEQRLALRQGQWVKLTPREQELLVLFLNTSQGYLSKDALADWCWERGKEPTSGLLHVNIRRLRQKLLALGGRIEVSYGAGYQLRWR